MSQSANQNRAMYSVISRKEIGSMHALCRKMRVDRGSVLQRSE